MILSQIASFLLAFIDKIGYFGILIGMILESSFFPFPSEIVLIPAGALVSQGTMSFILVFLFAIVGSLVGAYINYLIAFHLGRKTIEKLVSRYGKVFFMSSAELDKADHFFTRHGQITTFAGRLLPWIRQLISLPAGFSKMKLSRFFLFTAAGAGLWSLILICVGWLADRNQAWLSNHLSFITLLIVLAVIVMILVYLIFARRSHEE